MLTNILEFQEEIYDDMDEGKAFDVICIEFAKTLC